MTATFLLPGAVQASTFGVLLILCRSATKRSRAPIATGCPPFLARTHFPSHCLYLGQTLEHIAGIEVVSDKTEYAPSKSHSAIFAMNSGILLCTGHPSVMQGCFLHLRQRMASRMACSSENPRATSSKLLFLTAASCTGMTVCFLLILIM